MVISTHLCLAHFFYFTGSRITPVENTALFDWIFFSTPGFFCFLLSSVESIFVVFVLFLEAVCPREYTAAARQSKSVGSSVLHASSASNGSANSRSSELMALGFAESRQSYALGVALS